MITFCHAAGGTDLSESDREDLQQLERAVRGRLLELQLLKLSAQSQKGQAQHAALLDVSSSTSQPKVRSHYSHISSSFVAGVAGLRDANRQMCSPYLPCHNCACVHSLAFAVSITLGVDVWHSLHKVTSWQVWVTWPPYLAGQSVEYILWEKGQTVRYVRLQPSAQ